MVEKKRKRHERQINPNPMRLTERDIAVIEAVNRFRVLKQEQLQALFFGSKATAQFRLEKLYDHGYLERKFLPVMLGQGRSPTLYVLDRKGAELLRVERGYDDLVWYSTSKDLKTEFLEHTIAINDVMVAISVACNRLGFTLEQWHGENDLKASYDHVIIKGAGGKRERVPVLPDSYFTIVAYERRNHFFLELDRGTMATSRFKTKVQAYLAYHESGGYEKRYGTKSLRVLTVIAGSSSGEKRLVNLKTTTESVGGKRRFWFVTASNLKAETVLSSPIWQVASEEFPNTLLEPFSD
jgi:hypothetical protein